MKRERERDRQKFTGHLDRIEQEYQEKLRREIEEKELFIRKEGEAAVSKILTDTKRERKLLEEERNRWQETAVRLNQQVQRQKNNPPTQPPLIPPPNPQPRQVKRELTTPPLIETPPSRTNINSKATFTPHINDKLMRLHRIKTFH